MLCGLDCQEVVCYLLLLIVVVLVFISCMQYMIDYSLQALFQLLPFTSFVHRLLRIVVLGEEFCVCILRFYLVLQVSKPGESKWSKYIDNAENSDSSSDDEFSIAGSCQQRLYNRHTLIRKWFLSFLINFRWGKYSWFIQWCRLTIVILCECVV